MKEKKKHMRKTGKRTISFILIIALMVTGLNLDTMADSVYAAQKNRTESNAGKEKVTVVKELTGERTESTNTYLMSDGSKKMEVYGENIRYKEKGRWKDYDNTLNEISGTDEKKLNVICENDENLNAGEYQYVNTQGDSRQYFSKKLDKEHPIVMSSEKYAICFAPVSEDDKESKTEEGKNRTTVNEIEGKKYLTNEEEIIAQEEDGEDCNKVEYSSESQNIKYVYTSLNNGVKEEIVLDKKPERNTFEYKYDFTGMEPVKYDDNYILLTDKKNGNVVASISAPYVSDAQGNKSYDDVKMKLEKVEDDTYIVKLTVNSDYLNDESKYPITVDPSVYWDATKSSNINSYNENPSNAHAIPGSYRFYTGIDSEGYGQTAFILCSDVINALKGKTVNYAVFEPVIAEIGGTPEISIRNAESSCDFMNMYKGGKAEVGTKKYGIYKCEDNKIDDRIALYMTDIVREVAAEKIASCGIALKTENTNNGNYVTFYGPAEEKRPIFYVGYSETENINAKYDGSFVISGADDENEDETEIDLQWEAYEDADVYQVYVRENEGSFESVGITYGTEYAYKCSDNTEKTDFRVLAILKNQDEDIVTGEDDILSNIVSFDRVTETKQDENGNDVIDVSYGPVIRDTDGDGLEDGYEIWDFKTLWNETTGTDSQGNKIYDLDTDNDGLPDGYEVFTLGTDPAIKNEDGKDSDEDGLSDLEEYVKGTDPWLKDSDFDERNDSDELEETDPRKTDNPQLKGTDRLGAYSAQVHKGLYDHEYSETENGVTATYIVNIYRGDIKKITTNYGDDTLNKTVKYFYDEKGNNTAIIEENSKDREHTICITYTYDSDGNVTYICDQKTKYTMSYNDGEMTSLMVGNIPLVNYSKNILEDNKGENGDTTNIEEGEVVDETENVVSYGNGQKIKTVVSEIKADENNINSVATESKIYYNEDTTYSYIMKYNSEGQLLKLTDKTGSEDVSYDYIYNDNTVKVSRSDGFIKDIKTVEDEEGNITDTDISYTFKDIEGKCVTYKTSHKADISDENKTVITDKLYNNDSLTMELSDEGRTINTRLYSQLYKKDILSSEQKEVSDTKTTYSIGMYGEDKEFEYTYDLAGNITAIKQNGKKMYEYAYDVHGRLTKELDYTNNTGCTYGYSSTGNVNAKHFKTINEDGSLTNVKDKEYSYKNSDWADQLTKYDGEDITYDGLGNPVNYIDGKSFEWTRGRQLSKMTLKDNSEITYRYNQDGLRTYKETNTTSTDYEWDETKLIRETVTYKATGKKYDIWYFYNGNDEMTGFEYSQINDIDQSLKKTRIYFEKNMQGDVIGLLDSRGAEIATYAYDAWGNVTDTFCYEGNETPYALNHITYRGYYHDSESGFYYLQSRYYDAEVGRFVNADDVRYIGIADNVISKDNLYCYCNGNPISNLDPTGNASHKKKYSFKYNRSKARQYMVKYYNNPNPDYLYFCSDCTNYASQVLYAANVPMVEKSSGWYFHYVNDCFGEYTTSWTTVLENRKFVRSKLMGNFTTINRETSDKVTKEYMEKMIKSFNPQVGDIIYFYNREKKKYTHTAIISHVKKNDILYSGHTDNCLDKSLMGRLNKNRDYCHVEICHIKNKGKFYM